jgi:cytochrome c biogenesis protein CcdA
VLGAASVLASQGKNLGEVAAVMTLFGLGTAVPLLALGFISREAALRLRGKMAGAAHSMRFSMGVVLVVLGCAVLTGFDKQAETWLVNVSPEWLTKLTTSI